MQDNATHAQPTPNLQPAQQCAACGRPAVGVFLELPASGVLLAEPRCPDCARRAALRSGAEADLYAALWPQVQAWATRWAAAGLETGELSAILELLGEYWHPHGAQGRPGEAAQAVADALAQQ